MKIENEKRENLMQIEMVKVDELIPYANNPRKNDKAVKAVADSIKQFGFKVPITIDKNGIIVTGHTRLKAAIRLKMKEVPVIRVDDLTDEQVKAFRLVDNKVAEISEWDVDALIQELNEIEMDLSEFDFDMTQFEEPKPKESYDIKEDGYNGTAAKKTNIKQGDIYQLGSHRLMCGDSTNENDVDELIENEEIDLLFTDPPYGMGKENVGVYNDNLNSDDLITFNRLWIELAISKLKSNGSLYIWGTDESLMNIYGEILKPKLKRKEMTFRNLITWNKGSGQGQLSEKYMMYSIADEKCLFVVKGITGLTLNSDQYWDGYEPIRSYLEDEAKKLGIGNKELKEITGKASMYSHWFTKSQWNLISEENYTKLQQYYNFKAFKKPYEELRAEYDKLRTEYDKLRAYFNNTHDNMNNVWHFDRPSTQERSDGGNHATPKPIKLCARGIISSSRPGEKVLDLFGGSGSTLIACEQTNRKAYLMELSPEYCQTIINRWEDYTGLTAEKLN